MAFRSNGPISVVLPPFRGVTRQIILTAVAAFFALLVLGLFLREGAALMGSLLALSPGTSYKLLWQLITYPFVNSAIFSLLFAAISVWFFGSTLEDELGSGWMGEFFVATTVGGGVLAMLCVLVFGRLLSIPSFTLASGLWPFSLALLMVFASLHADQELNFNFILRLKAKYIAIIYLLVYLAVALASHERFDAVLVLANCLAGWIFLRFAPRRGLQFGANEAMYGWKNAYIRARRRRAAKKFSVYMQKQGRDVQFDDSGRYVDPDGKPRDPNDRRWMN